MHMHHYGRLAGMIVLSFIAMDTAEVEQRNMTHAAAERFT